MQMPGDHQSIPSVTACSTKDHHRSPSGHFLDNPIRSTSARIFHQKQARYQKPLHRDSIDAADALEAPKKTHSVAIPLKRYLAENQRAKKQLTI
jgi:hypothetical protein